MNVVSYTITMLVSAGVMLAIPAVFLIAAGRAVSSGTTRYSGK